MDEKFLTCIVYLQIFITLKGKMKSQTTLINGLAVILFDFAMEGLDDRKLISRFRADKLKRDCYEIYFGY